MNIYDKLQITQLDTGSIESQALKMAETRLDLTKVPKGSKAFLDIVDRFEEGITRMEAIKYWSKQSSLEKMSLVNTGADSSVQKLAQVR